MNLEGVQSPGARRTVVGIDIGGGAAIIYRMAMIRIVAQLSTLLAVTWGVFGQHVQPLDPASGRESSGGARVRRRLRPRARCDAGGDLRASAVLTRNVARRRVALALVASLTVSVISFASVRG